ncbi:MAG: c-type cytochrome [Myxococcales bacterium]|nr:c-type cytochrome [Myxococcales bacterium]MCB9629365.1 c-type cytochrome [Sandaracinaceae bacterium]
MSDGNRHDEIQGEIIHVYDGIEEADNELPLWWLFTFYGAVIFAVCYWFYYEGFEVGASPMQAYAAELAESAAAGGEVSNELIEAMAMDPSAVAAGRETFQAQCAVCHREDAGGNIGPNLTDPNWIHGGSPVNIHDTIRDGVPTAAMPAWGAVLGPVAVQQVTAFVVSLRNTNVDGKEAQGEVWSPGGAASAGAEPETAPEADATADAGVAAEAADGGANAEPTTPEDGAAPVEPTPTVEE